jgi:hypothetical protein
MGGPPTSGPPTSGPPTSGPPVSGGGGGIGGPPPYQGGYQTPPPQPPRRSPLPILLAVCAVLGVAVVIVGIIAVVRPSSHPDAHPSHSPKPASPTASPSPSPNPSPSPGAGVEGKEIVDTQTGWRFKKAGSPWKNVAVPTISEMNNPVGQSVQLGYESYATMELGELKDSFGYGGPSTLKSVKSTVITEMLSKYYGDGATPISSDSHINKHLVQYGYDAWLWAYDVSYTASGTSYTEYVVMALLDSSSGNAAMFWGSIPDGNNALKSDMINAASSLKPGARG